MHIQTVVQTSRRIRCIFVFSGSELWTIFKYSTDERIQRMRSSLVRMRSSLVRMRSSLVRMRSSLERMRSSLVRTSSSLVVRASDCQVPEKISILCTFKPIFLWKNQYHCILPNQLPTCHERMAFCISRKHCNIFEVYFSWVSEVFRKNKKGGCYHPRW